MAESPRIEELKRRVQVDPASIAFAALAEKAEIRLPKLSSESLQGDSAIVKIMESLGVGSRFENGLLHLSKKAKKKQLHWDFTHCPDLAQTVAVICAAKNVKGYFTGLESLRIKETDRIAALQTELGKIEPAFNGPGVQGLNILEHNIEFDSFAIDLFIDKSIEYKSIVGTG